MAYEIGIRIDDEGRSDPRQLIRVHEFEAPGLVFDIPGLSVSAAKVRHPPLTHAYAYRFDAPDRSILLSGDTAVSPALVELAQGSDVLVHEAMHLAGLDRLLANASHAAMLREHLLASHTVTADIGGIAAAAGVKTLVLNHFVPGGEPSITDEMWLEAPRRDFAGEALVGRDLQVI
jgi:ribonuclease BN (tRNA processing enzyme)